MRTVRYLILTVQWTDHDDESQKSDNIDDHKQLAKLVQLTYFIPLLQSVRRPCADHECKKVPPSLAWVTVITSRSCFLFSKPETQTFLKENIGFVIDRRSLDWRLSSSNDCTSFSRGCPAKASDFYPYQSSSHIGWSTRVRNDDRPISYNRHLSR